MVPRTVENGSRFGLYNLADGTQEGIIDVLVSILDALPLDIPQTTGFLLVMRGSWHCLAVLVFVKVCRKGVVAHMEVISRADVFRLDIYDAWAESIFVYDSTDLQR